MKTRFVKSFKIISIVLICVILIIIGIFNSVGKFKTQSPSLPSNNFISIKDSSRYIKPIFEKVDIEANTVYAEATNYKGQQEKLLLDVYKPSGDKETNRPAIIWIHGGGYTSGSKDSGIQKDLAIDFAKKGYVTLSINYRLGQDGYAGVKDAVNDANAAYKWLIENSQEYGVDKNHIAFGGYSAGGNVVINLCFSNSKDYGIDKKGIFAAIDLAGGQKYLEDEYENSPPCIIIQGTSDSKVPYSSSEDLAKNLREKGIYYTLYPIKGCDHDLTSSYNDIANEITKFLYKTLTGKDIQVAIDKGSSRESDKIKQRQASGKAYNAKQVNIKVDGKLDEWGNADIINLDQLKDAGTIIPSKEDFSGTARVGWNDQDPTRIYIAAVITDDVIQDINDAQGKWFNDDCLEIAFDLSNSNKLSTITKWVIGATGKDLSVLANKENTEYKIVKEGNKYFYEMAIDIAKADANSGYKIKAQDNIGFSLSYNDSENEIRECQIGWTPSGSNDRGNFGNLIFVTDKVK